MLRDTLEPAEPRAALNTAEAIEALLSRLEGSARQQREPAEFFQQLLRDVVGALSAISGSVWSETDQGLNCLERVGGGTRAANSLPDATEQRLAAAALLDGEPHLVPPGEGVPGGEVRNDSECLQCLVPRSAPGVPGVVLRVALRPDASLHARETASGLLQAVAEIALSFQIQHRLRTLHQHESFWRELDAALLAINTTRLFTDTARTMAEQVRRMVGCDRVSVLVRRGSRCRLAAVSSATEANRRARQVRLLERIAGEALNSGGSFQVQVGAGGSPLRISEAVETYLDETQLRTVRCDVLTVPDGDEPRPVGCLVCDSFTGEPADQWASQLSVLAAHCGVALDRAVREQDRGWRRLLHPLRSLSRTAVWLLGLGLGVAAVAALTFVRTDFTIEADGRLMPVERRGVFAPADAIVTDILVADGSVVTVGQPLAKLIDSDLELEYSRLEGELQTAAARLDAVQARRKLLRGNRDVDASLLSIEEEELKATVAGLERQRDIVQRQRERLSVLSPLAGRVARWDLKEVLQSLPVRHGQNLMDVYNPDGPWRLELQIPDSVAGYVRLAAQSQPRVEFVFQTDPGRVQSAVLNTLSDATDLDAKGQLSVRGIVELPQGEVAAPQRGASVTAKIHCGRRAVGFVWFREVIEFVQRRVLF